MKLTLEALYTLHLFNDSSDDLFLLPLPMKGEETRLESLRRVLLKGYEDLQALGLIVNDEPTQICVDYGLLINLYSNALFHAQVDERYFCALAVEPDDALSIIIERTDDGGYIVERIGTAHFLGLLQQNHPILEHLDELEKNYALSDWMLYSRTRLLLYYANNESIRLATYRAFQVQEDRLFVELPSGLFEYDLLAERLRSIEPEILKDKLLRGLKVRLTYD